MIEDGETGDRPTIWTIGHGTRSKLELAALLRAAGIENLVDIRRFPGSHRNPQFSLERLAVELPAAGIDYEWRGDELGGRRALGLGNRQTSWTNRAFRAYAAHMESADFRTALAVLEAETAAGRRPARRRRSARLRRCRATAGLRRATTRRAYASPQRVSRLTDLLDRPMTRTGNNPSCTGRLVW